MLSIKQAVCHCNHAIAEGQDFAPVPSKLNITLQHEDQKGAWQPLQLSNLGVLQHQGPFIHEANIPEALAARDFRLRVLDWPIYCLEGIDQQQNKAQSERQQFDEDDQANLYMAAQNLKTSGKKGLGTKSHIGDMLATQSWHSQF